MEFRLPWADWRVLLAVTSSALVLVHRLGRRSRARWAARQEGPEQLTEGRRVLSPGWSLEDAARADDHQRQRLRELASTDPSAAAELLALLRRDLETAESARRDIAKRARHDPRMQAALANVDTDIAATRAELEQLDRARLRP